MSDPVRKLALEDGRYAPEAFAFLLESLDHAIRLAGREEAEGQDRHVSGRELLAGLRAHASEIFGPLAGEVWRRWGIRESLDWGRIVFLLVEAQMLNRQEHDTIDDFRSDLDFDQVFVRSYRPKLPPELFPRGGGERPQQGS